MKFFSFNFSYLSVYIKWNEKLFHEMYQAYLSGRAEKGKKVCFILERIYDEVVPNAYFIFADAFAFPVDRSFRVLVSRGNWIL